MTELQRYLAEEVADDHADGVITRREAMRRLGLLGVAGPAALLLLDAGAARASSRGHHGVERGPTTTEWAVVPTEPITFPGPNGTLLGAWAPAADTRGGALVIHENRGLNDHIRSVAGRLAAVGYAAIAIDLLSEEGGTDALPDDAARSAALAAAPPERFDADMKAGVTELKRRLPGEKLAAIGFCFGGAMVWRLLAARERRLAAAAPFYGPFPDGGDLRGTKAAVLANYGGLDDRVNATIPAARTAMEAARLEHAIVVYGGANHAFFNDTGNNFNPAAMAEAYRRVLDWYDRFVARGHGRD